MKKLFLMLASMLFSMSIFASKEVAPVAKDLANYYDEGQLCIAVYFEAEVCNDIVFVGTYNNWSEDISTMTRFEPLDGFDGWYVVAVTDESEEIWGKPIQLKSDGSFAWDYQTGDAASWTLVSGIVTISNGYAGEADLRSYDKSAPVVMISSYFKNHNDVCAPIPHHTYTVNLKAPICGSDPTDHSTYFAPAIIGNFNGWTEGVAMTLNEETKTYSYTFEDEEGHSFKFKALGDTDWTNDIQLLVKNEETGEESWQGNPNITLGEIEVINIDYSAGRYTLCDNDDIPTVPENSIAWQESLDKNGTYIDKSGEQNWGTNWPYVSQWWEAGNMANEYTSVTSYNCTIRDKKLNDDASKTIGFYFGANKEADKCYFNLINDKTPIYTAVDGDILMFEIASPENGAVAEDITEKLLVSINGTTLTIPTNIEVPANASTITVQLNLPSGNIHNIHVACNNVTTQKFITIFHITHSLGTYHYTVQAGENGALSNGNLSGTHTATCSHPTHTIYDICAFPYYGYKFTGWSDGIADQCRSITINRDTTITAIFEPAGQVNLLVGIANGCDSMGSVNGSGTYYEQSWASIEATPNTGYHFVEWSDGNPNAQRDIYLTSDTTLFATFAPGYFGGKCGEHLYWNITNDTLFITGTGAMDIDNYTTWHNSTYDGYYISFHISDIVFPDGLTSIPAQAFYNYHVYNGYVMETVVIPASVEYIGHHAFASCNNLKKWQYLGNNLELGYSVDDNWNNCILANNSGNIQFLQGPAALINECGNNYSWYSLDTLIITNGYYSIYKYTNQSYYDASKSSSDGYYYGYYRSDLLPYRTFFFPEDVVEIGDFALMNARYLGGVTIPAGVTRIGESAFEECRSLDSVVFAGNNLETIGDWAFYNCHDLKKINLPEGVQEVGKAAFFNCTYLSELTIPSTMQRIADNGFGACAKMQRMYVNALIPPVIDEKTFEDVNRSIPVFVPKGTLERYRGDRYWSEFFNITEYNAPTGILNASTQGEDNTRKVLRNGQVLIIRGDQTYTVLGDKL